MTENLSVERNTSNQRKLERFQEKKFKTFEEANEFRIGIVEKLKPAKTKIFARYDGTYDVVAYKKIQTADEKAFEKKVEKAGEEIKKTKRRSAVIDTKKPQ